ncbi:hypothetical protein ACF0H5_019573 [Mactra antiquata]
MDCWNKASLLVLVIMCGMVSCSFINIKKDVSDYCPSHQQVSDALTAFRSQRMTGMVALFRTGLSMVSGAQLEAIMSSVCSNDMTGLLNISNVLSQCPSIKPLVMSTFNEDHQRICDGSELKSWVVNALTGFNMNMIECVFMTDVDQVVNDCADTTMGGYNLYSLPENLEDFIEAFEAKRQSTDALYKCLREGIPPALDEDNPCGITLKNLMSIFFVHFTAARQPHIGLSLTDDEFARVKGIMTGETGMRKRNFIFW